MKIKKNFNDILSPTAIADFFLPRFCPGCKLKLKINESAFCNLCLAQIKEAENYRLRSEFERKFRKEKAISDFTSAFIFEKDRELQSIIHALKYDKKIIIGKRLGKLLAEIRKEVFLNWHLDIIIPIPLHQLKQAERGFNQSYFISKGLSKNLQLKMVSKLVKRVKFTKSQTTLTLEERAENMAGAFRATNNKLIKNRNLLIVDDVITTGATTNECGKILLEAGANAVFAASVAIAE